MSVALRKLTLQVLSLEKELLSLKRAFGILSAQFEQAAGKNNTEIRDLSIFSAYLTGVKQSEIAKRFKLSPGRVSQIINGMGDKLGSKTVDTERRHQVIKNTKPQRKAKKSKVEKTDELHS